MQKQNLKVSSAAIFGSFSKGKSGCSVGQNSYVTTHTLISTHLENLNPG